MTRAPSFALLAALVTACGEPPHAPPRAANIEHPRGDAGAEVAHTAHPPMPDANEKSTQAHPCTVPADIQAARDLVAALAVKVKSAPPNADGKALDDALNALLETKCFRLAIAHHARFDSALSAQTWWERGGEWWLETTLAFGEKVDHTLVMPPEVLPTLTSDRASAPASPLAPLLCPSASATCGRETAGWMIRAERALTAHGQREKSRNAEEPAPASTDEECEKEALREPLADRFTHYAICVSNLVRTRDALPLGHFRAPTTGWITMRGFRGHMRGCNEARAYDLATGAAYVAKRCTNASPEAEVGRVPVDALREAALIVLLARISAHEAIVTAEGHALPPSIPLFTEAVGLGRGASGGFSSGRTTFDVSWLVGKASIAATTVDVPDSHHGVDEHASTLVAVLEASFSADGCTTAKLPEIAWDAPGPRVQEKMYVPKFDQPMYVDLARDLEALRQKPACPPRAR